MSLILSGSEGLSDVDGTAATPAIRGTDTNTGIFFPAADTIAFAEGGVESMRLDSSGNLGIGTTSLSNGVRTVIQGSQTGGAPQTSGTTQTFGLLRLQGTSFTSALDFGTNGGNYAWIQSTDQTNLATNYSLVLNPNGGNVGIGTTSPATRLQVNGQTRVSDGTTNIDIVCASSTGFIGTQTNAPLVLRTNDTERARIASNGDLTLRTGGSSTTTHIFGFNEGGGEFNLCDNTGTGGTLIDLAFGSTRLLHVLSTGNQTLGIGSGNTTGVIQFMRAGFVEAARIDSSGNLLVGTTSSLGTLATSSNASGFIYGPTDAIVVAVNNNSSNLILNRTNNNTVGDAVSIRYNGSGVGSIRTNGSSTSYNTSSDYRLKENIAPMTGALARVSALKPVTYTWKSTGEADEGFIAHELAEVCPSAVTGEKDAVDADGNPVYQGIDTSFLVATLTAAIQELKAELDAVKTELAALKGTA